MILSFGLIINRHYLDIPPTAGVFYTFFNHRYRLLNTLSLCVVLTCIGRDVTKISSYRVNTTSRQGINQLGISFRSIFLLFSNATLLSRGPHS